MKLGPWIKKEKITLEEFGERIRRGHSTVGRYIAGLLFPGRETLRDIYVETYGEVTPNDFCDLPPFETVRRKEISEELDPVSSRA